MISHFFDDSAKMPETLGPPLLWACFEPSMEHRVPEWLRMRVKDKCEACRPPAFEAGVNPIKRVPVVIFQVGEQVCIEEIAEMVAGANEPAANAGQQQQRQREQQHGAQGVALHVTAQLHAIQLKLTRLENTVEAGHGELKQDM